MDDRSATTVIEALASSLEAASKHNPGDVEKPAAIVWTDHDAQWQPIIPQLRQLMPHLLTLGEYQPEQRTGPAIWLRCVVDHTLEEPKISKGTRHQSCISPVSADRLSGLFRNARTVLSRW